jgi:hypothetical protein
MEATRTTAAILATPATNESPSAVGNDVLRTPATEKTDSDKMDLIIRGQSLILARMDALETSVGHANRTLDALERFLLYIQN